MTVIAFLRHGETAWNKAKRLQGRADIPLTDEARAKLARLQVPAPWRDAIWVTSPLARARQTAAALQLDAASATALMETDWGDWEGQTLKDLRAADPDTMAAHEAQGLDLTPPNGESPRAVRARLIAWARALPDRPHGAVTHKGVIRAALSSALDWDMRADCPVKIDWSRLQILRLADGRFHVAALNQPLEVRP